MPPERAAHVEGAVEVDVDHRAPLLDLEVDHRDAIVAAGGAGVVDDDVDAPELVEHVRRERADRPGIGHVADHRERAAALSLHLVGHRVDVSPPGLLLIVRVPLRGAPGAGEHDVAAGSGQLHGDRPPDRAHPAGARDHRDLVLESGEEQSAHAGESGAR